MSPWLSCAPRPRWPSSPRLRISTATRTCALTPGWRACSPPPAREREPSPCRRTWRKRREIGGSPKPGAWRKQLRLCLSRVHEARSRIRRVQLLDHSGKDLIGSAGPLFYRAPLPALQVGVHLGRALAHGVGIDRDLEAIGHHALDLDLALPGLDLRRYVLPEHHLVAGHAV